MHTTSPEITRRLVKAGFPYQPQYKSRFGDPYRGFILTEILEELPESCVHRLCSPSYWVEVFGSNNLWTSQVQNNPCDAAGEVWLRLNGKEVTP